MGDVIKLKSFDDSELEMENLIMEVLSDSTKVSDFLIGHSDLETMDWHLRQLVSAQQHLHRAKNAFHRKQITEEQLIAFQESFLEKCYDAAPVVMAFGNASQRNIKEI